MNLGPNTELVNEIFTFLNEGNFFRPLKEKINGIQIIHDFEEAQKIAFSTQKWTDIREAEMGVVKGNFYENPTFSNYKEPLYSLHDIIFEIIDDKHLENEMLSIRDDVVADIYSSAWNRAINGIVDNFYEKILQVYFKGGWPCAWSGEYDFENDCFISGELIAYFSEK